MKKYGPASRHTRRLVLKLLRGLAFNRVLDVGCGQGALLSHIVETFPDTAPNGIDISAAAVELASSRFPEGRFSVLDIEHEKLEATFDLVTCTDVLEHLEDDVQALKNIRSMTKGYLIASSLQGRMRRFEPEQVGHVRNYQRNELQDKITSAGFSIVKVIEWGFPFYSPLYRDLLEATAGKGTTGEFGLTRRLIASLLYGIFSLNSHHSGDAIFVLAKVVE